jgi:ParB family chromosome partitioning protein
LAEAIGKSRSHVTNTLRLLTLPASVQELVEDGRLSAGHARALVGSPGTEALAQTVVEQGLNVRQTEALVRLAQSSTKRQSRTDRAEDPNVTELSRRMSEQLGLEVRLRTKGKGGVLTIRYHDLDQLDGLIKRLQ